MLFHIGTAVSLVLEDLGRTFDGQLAWIKKDQRAIGRTGGGPAILAMAIRHHLDINVAAERNVATKAFTCNFGHCLASYTLMRETMPFRHAESNVGATGRSQASGRANARDTAAQSPL